jgi:hypothetical protein
MRRGINLVGPFDLAFLDGAGNFQSLTAGVLGNELTDADGFVEELNAVASTLGASLDLLDSLDQHLADGAFVLGALESQQLLPVLQSHADLVAAGDPLLDGTIATIGNDPTSSPPGGPSGGPGNEGGPGGTSSGTGTPGCKFADDPGCILEP